MFRLSLILAAFLAGCSTVHQNAVDPETAGFYVPPRPIPGGYVVDAAFRDRYNALVSTYGRKVLANGAPVFAPPLSKDDGIIPLSDGSFYMSLAAMDNMVVLSALHHRGAAP